MTDRRPNRPVTHPCPLSFVAGLAGPERLVGIGFRCWMAGYQTGDIACWEEAWNAYAAALGTQKARVAIGELGCWVRTIREATSRDIATFPGGCRGFCRDECVAVSMIAASQHQACPALRACAATLLGCSSIDAVVHETDSFAATLAGMDQVLAAHSISITDRLTPTASLHHH
jgi:hypothetical protein